jgi:hypothetical protein
MKHFKPLHKYDIMDLLMNLIQRKIYDYQAYWNAKHLLAKIGYLYVKK